VYVAGFLQVRKTGKNQGICVVRESQGKILLSKIQGKVRKNDLGSCKLQISVMCL